MESHYPMVLPKMDTDTVDPTLPEKTVKEFRYRNASVTLFENAPPEFQNNLVRMLLSEETDPAPKEKIEKYFGPFRMPGTSSIGVRKENPSLFQDSIHADFEPYDFWLNKIVCRIVSNLNHQKTMSCSTAGTGAAVDIFPKVRTLLEFRSSDGVLLRNLIPQQTYEDTLQRMVMVIDSNTFTDGAPNHYEGFNAVCRRIALSLLNLLASDRGLSPDDAAIENLVHISVLSGYVGVNLKSTASAASTLLNRDLIPVDRRWICSRECAARVPASDIRDVARRLIDVSREYRLGYGLDCFSSYVSEVINARTPTLLVFFSDDYLESIIDLKRFELILEKNPYLTVLMAPRNGRYGNDFAFQDVDEILKEPVFDKLISFRNRGRFIVSGNGPRGGCIDPRFLSRGLMAEVGRAVARGKNMVVETKGCRNFEMLRGRIPLPWYASFNCNRALSIRTVGIDIDPVFLRIPPGLWSYDRFDAPKLGDTPSGATLAVRFAGMTTRDLLVALENERYRKLRSHAADELGVNTWLIDLCDKTGLTLPELLEMDNLNAVLQTT